MKILVCISKTPDTTAPIAFTDGNTRFSEENVTYIMNPTDEWYALVRAIELQETEGATVTVINVGPAENDPIIRKALALNANDAVRIDKAPTDSYEVGAQIAAYAKDQNFDIVFTGKETIDHNGFIVAAVIAEELDMPYVSLASKLELNGNTATIEREIEGGEEVVEVATPFVVSCQKGMAEQRIPNMRGIMAARTKPLNVIPAADIAAFTQVKEFILPAGRTEVNLVDPEDMDKLVELLANEAKVI